jgi:hypothetical protein
LEFSLFFETLWVLRVLEMKKDGFRDGQRGGANNEMGIGRFQ